ncbi:MAG: hypothetical protein OXT69_01525 [Candidatus Poribacteria bacterium]|nr:hypothetical protein [Candidatus Poribacteria bacterium]
MADQNDLEIYKQRYETYRHLDRLRWLMFLAAVGVALLYLLLGGFRFGSAGWLVLGVLLLSLGAAKLRIGQKAAEFAEALAAFAQSSENAENLPETPQQGASFWFGRILAAFGVGCFPAALIFYIDDLAGSDGHFIWSWNVWAVAGVFLICSGLAKLRIGNPNAEVLKLARKGWNYWVVVGLAAAGCLLIGYILFIFPAKIKDAPDELLKSLPYIAFFAVMGASLTAPWLARRRFGYRRLVRSKLLRRFWEEVGGMDAPTGAPFWLAYYMTVAGVVSLAFAAVSFFTDWK